MATESAATPTVEQIANLEAIMLDVHTGIVLAKGLEAALDGCASDDAMEALQLLRTKLEFAHNDIDVMRGQLEASARQNHRATARLDAENPSPSLVRLVELIEAKRERLRNEGGGPRLRLVERETEHGPDPAA